VEEVFAALGIAELRRLQSSEKEKRKLKQVVADLSLDKKILWDRLSNNLRPAVKRVVVQEVRVCHRVIESLYDIWDVNQDAEYHEAGDRGAEDREWPPRIFLLTAEGRRC